MACLRSHITTVVVTIVATAAYFTPGAADLLDLRPSLVIQGELWRIVTCHLTHCGFGHLAWDLLVFIALGCWVESRIGPGKFGVLLLLTSILLGLCLMIGLPEQLDAYRGLSGVDSALFAYLTTALIFEFEGKARLLPGVMLSLFLIKTTGEIFAGHSIFVQDHSMSLVPLAHLGGGIIGGIAIPLLAPARAISLARNCNRLVRTI